MNKKEIVNKEPIEHGGNLRAFALRFQIPENEILDFSSNINPLGIPDSVRRLYLESVKELSRYPDPSSTELCREITRHFLVQPENVIAGNGSMALLGLAVRALAPKRALLIEPCFSEYRRLLEQQSAEVHSILLRQEEDFNFKLSEIFKALPGKDLLIFGHPNNPTGTALGRSEILHLFGEAERQGVFVVVDEAFADWVPEISTANEVRKRSNLLVVRSLTKFFALAGIRSGFALGPSRLISAMKNYQETWSVNRLAEKLSVAALRDKGFQDKSREWFQKESLEFRKALEALGAFKVYPSLASFFLIRLSQNAESPLDFLGRNGICIRPAQNFRGLDSFYFRTAVRLSHQNQFLVQSLQKCLRLPSPFCLTS